MFSATMTSDVDALIQGYFHDPAKLSVAVSGTRLQNITQLAFSAPNFNTKANLVAHLLHRSFEMDKVLVFTPSKRIADRLFDRLQEDFYNDVAIIHSNKSQNARLGAIESFESGSHRILIATDVIARGIDFENVSHVVSFNVPEYPENYLHRIGRTGRAERDGTSILLFDESEIERKQAVEDLMKYEIPTQAIPQDVEISRALIPEEKPNFVEQPSPHKHKSDPEAGAAFHEKSAKNSKVNLGSRYHREIKTKFKKPKTKGDKNQNRRKR
ncbi:MAG: hypothetical protein Salg2KO_23270 [Salibacteraceae bacterium]